MGEHRPDHLDLYDDELAFDMPHRRQSHLLNTPCLISQHVVWHADRPVPTPGHDLRRRYTDQASGVTLIDETGDDKKAIAAVGVNRYLDHIFEHATPGVNAGLRFTTLLSLCKASEGERRRLTAPRRNPDTTFINRTLAVSGEIGGLTFEVIVDIHQEYHTVCFRAFPLHKFSASEQGSSELNPKFKAATEYLTFLSKLEPSVMRTDADDAIGATFDIFWDEFYSQIADEHPEGAEILFGASQAVFRGVVLRTLDVDEQSLMQGDGPRPPEVPYDGPDGLLINPLPEPPGTPDPAYESLTNNANLTSRATFGSLQQQVNNHRWFFGRFFGHGEKESWVESTRATNSVMSGLSDGLAIYGTDLGAHLPSSNEYPHKQVRFFLIYGGNSRDHLGRLVRRILYCGETRIAALKRFKYLRGVGKEILRLKERYDDLTATLLTENNLNEIREKIAKLDRDLQGAVFSGPGIQKYLSRSQYYFRTLDELILGLREVRVLGWQTYGDFIDARLGATAEAIHSLQDDLTSLLLARERAERRIMLAENKAISQQNQIITRNLGLELSKIDKMQEQQVRNSATMRLLTVVILAVSVANMLPFLIGRLGAQIMAVFVAVSMIYLAYDTIRRVYRWLFPRKTDEPSATDRERHERRERLEDDPDLDPSP